MSAGELTVLILVNAAAWAAVHMGLAWGGTQLPASWFRPGAWWFRVRAFERDGTIYQRLFRIKQWKDAMPDGASWFRGGFPKAALSASDPEYMRRFVVETCRGEAVHWAVFLCGPLFFLWNSVPVGWAMVAYAAVANVPCILIQRYNRARLQRLLDRRAGPKGGRRAA